MGLQAHVRAYSWYELKSTVEHSVLRPHLVIRTEGTLAASPHAPGTRSCPCRRSPIFHPPPRSPSHAHFQFHRVTHPDSPCPPVQRRSPHDTTRPIAQGAGVRSPTPHSRRGFIEPVSTRNLPEVAKGNPGRMPTSRLLSRKGQRLCFYPYDGGGSFPLSHKRG
jgi:hypothetical protein